WHVDDVDGAEGLSTILGGDYMAAGLRIEGRATRRSNRDRAVPWRMPLVRARRRRDAGKVVRATEPCDSRREMGDPDTERGRAPALPAIRRYRDQHTPLLLRVGPACRLHVSVP